VDYVLLDERVDPEAVCDLLYHLGVVDSDDVYPGDGGAIPEVGALINGSRAELMEALFVVVEDGDPDGLGPLFADVDQRPRGEAHLIRPDLQ